MWVRFPPGTFIELKATEKSQKSDKSQTSLAAHRKNPRLRRRPNSTGFAQIVSDDFPMLHALILIRLRTGAVRVFPTSDA
jgi:hypothetical protein